MKKTFIKRNFAEKVFTLSMVGIELGSCEFKSKSSNHWAVEATDEIWHKIAQWILLPITFLCKETDRKKSNGQFRILISFGNGILPPVSAPLMHVIYWWLPFDTNFVRYVGWVVYFKVVGAHDIPIIIIGQLHAASECHLPDEILVYIDFFSMHTLRIP